MPTHRDLCAPFCSPADVARQFLELNETRTASISLTHPIDDQGLLLDILDRARQSEIEIRTIATERGQFLRDDAFLTAVQDRCPPHAPEGGRPWQTIRFEVSLDDPSRYRQLRDDLRDHVAAMQALRVSYDVAFEARLTFACVDGEALATLVQDLVDNHFSKVCLDSAFAHPSAFDIRSVKQQMDVFCAHPIARHPSIRVRNLPFCFLPSTHFRPLYRELLEALPSQAHLYRQRALIEKRRATEHRYQAPCRGCRRRAGCYAATPLEEHPEYRDHLVPSEEDAIAFVGASLTATDRRAFAADDLVFTTPAEQGDVFMALLDGFRTILLLDGYFYQRYALTTFEVLLGLLENVNIFGASSLGALRAVELANYGMRGEGYVFRWLRGFKIVPYHVVAQTYDASDRAQTDPLIAIHRFLERAEEENIIDRRGRERAYSTAEELHFSGLTFRTVFMAWERSRCLAPEVIARLKRFYEAQGDAAFNVKRQDAVALLESFRTRIQQDGPDYSSRTLQRARDKYLARLRSKYVDHYDSSLPEDWRASGCKIPVAGRVRSICETLEVVEKFFCDLDVVIANTSLLDRASYCMVNVVFVPFFFLEYGNSAGTGYGETMEQALVSAYGEVLERIPCGTLRTNFATPEEVGVPVFPFAALPFFESSSADKVRFFVGEHGRLRDEDTIACSDLFTGQTFAISKLGARLPNSCGMAAGNNLVEAVLYGLYEVIEHDVYACYETNALMSQLHRVNMDADVIEDQALRSLIAELTDRGHRIHFFNLLNRYGIPMVLCAFYEADRQLVFSGQCCRLDMLDAMAHSFHEALNGHYVSYFGSRDDRRGFEQQRASGPLRFLERFVDVPKCFVRSVQAPQTLSEELDAVLNRLQRCGIEHVFAIDLSPRRAYRLAVAKVVVPGMDYRTADRRTPNYYQKCVATHRLLTEFVADGMDVDAGAWSRERRAREFSRPRQRFFKA